MRRVARALAVVGLTAGLSGVGSGAAADDTPSLVLEYGSGDYHYAEVAVGGGPTGFSEVGFDDSAFAVGTAPFGQSVDVFACPLEATTPWAPNTDLLVRRNVTLPAGATNVVIHVAIDNDLELFWNGVSIADVQHDGCPTHDSVEIEVPIALLTAGANTMAARASDRGGETFLDLSITANMPPDCESVNVDQTLLWPPNHSLRTVTAVGGADPEGETVALSVVSVTQDEALDDQGDAKTTPDADREGLPANQVRLRAERMGGDDGRVYRVGVVATDQAGASCVKTILVGVPHDQGGAGPVDTTSVVVDSFGSDASSVVADSAATPRETPSRTGPPTDAISSDATDVGSAVSDTGAPPSVVISLPVDPVAAPISTTDVVPPPAQTGTTEAEPTSVTADPVGKRGNSSGPTRKQAGTPKGMSSEHRPA